MREIEEDDEKLATNQTSPRIANNYKQMTSQMSNKRLSSQLVLVNDETGGNSVYSHIDTYRKTPDQKFADRVKDANMISQNAFSGVTSPQKNTLNSARGGEGKQSHYNKELSDQRKALLQKTRCLQNTRPFKLDMSQEMGGTGKVLQQ